MNRPTLVISLAALAFGTLTLTSCRERDRNSASSAKQANALEAVAILSPTEGNNVDGVVTFIETAEGVRVVAEVVGLTQGEHGFHLIDEVETQSFRAGRKPCSFFSCLKILSPKECFPWKHELSAVSF